MAQVVNPVGRALVATGRAGDGLRGPFAPVDDELDVADLPVRGELPVGLEGTYVRNGPNPLHEPIGGAVPPFDGDGMLHAVTIVGGRASYRNRWVETKGLQAERRERRALYGGMFSPVEPDQQLIGDDGDPGPVKNVANTSVVRHLGRIFALWEGGLPYEVTHGLRTVGECDFGGRLPGAMTAHPKLDPVWDELVFFRYDLVPPYLMIGSVGPKGTIQHLEEVHLPEPVMIHDFVATDRHVVIFDSPAVFDVDAMLRGEPLLRWDESRGTRIGVMPRDGSGDEMAWIPVENCFAMHFMNGYSDGDTVIVDYVYRRRFDLSPARELASVPRLHRAVIDLARGAVTDELVDDRPLEFPTVDPRRVGLPHRFGYAPVANGSDDAGAEPLFDTLVRYDFAAGTTREHRFPTGVDVGEAVFASRPDSVAEDDGWVLALTYDLAHDTSTLVVLDALDLGGPPVAEVLMPRRIPAGSHGLWMPRSA